MFSGPDGISVQPNYRASAYLDRRIYEPHSKMARTTPALDVDSLWTRAKQMPIEWLTDTALRSLSKCLGVLADEKKLQAIFELITDFSAEKVEREFLPDHRQRGFPDRLSCAGVQGA
jgi:hypothetical protein